jgi:multidrug efflux pump subunit AcrA (membrane-fusion protein)
VVLALLMLPIHQTVLAPAEIIALNAVAVAAPVEGVIKTFHVQPNQPVRAGQRLFSFDDTTLRNRRDIAARGLDVAAIESHGAQQRAFDDTKARGEVATLQGRIAERRAELRAVEEQLRRIDVTAPRDGIAVFGDVNDWQGRPVVIGERVMQLADPDEAGVMVFLAVADAIALEQGARIRLFLDVAPLAPLDATLSETSYLAVLSPDGVASYRLRARLLAPGAGAARIGLKGTAKVYGEQVTLAYYLFRRPLSALRQWAGV